ncbi:hypothetical protein D3C76_1259840 [compost metagenome]
MIQRWQHPAGLQQLAVQRAGLAATGQHLILQAVTGSDGGQGKFAGGGGGIDQLDLVALDHAYMALAAGGLELDQSHGDGSRCGLLAGTLRIPRQPA